MDELVATYEEWMEVAAVAAAAQTMLPECAAVQVVVSICQEGDLGQEF